MTRGEKAMRLAVVAMIVAVGALAGCSDEPEEAPWQPPVMPIDPRDESVRPPEKEPTAFDPQARYEAVVTTNLGTFRMTLHGDETPKTVERFLWLAADWRLYNGMPFFRVISDVLIQTGDISTTGAGHPEGPGAIKGEFTARKFVPGTVGFARREDMSDSGDSQWFVCLARREDWDGKFAAFATVTEGLDVVRAISRVEVEGDRAIAWTRRQRPVDLPFIENVEIIKTPPPAGNSAGDQAADDSKHGR